MSRESIVGIIGASGAIGAIVARELVARGVSVILGERTRGACQELAKSLGVLATTQHADISDADSLRGFCAAVGVVVNCAGPSVRIGEHVARVAIELGCHYIDPGIWSKPSPTLEQMATEKGLCALLYAGFVPGLTGLLPRLALERAQGSFDTIEALDLFVGDRSPWSKNATLDILHHFIRGIEPGLFEHGQWRKKNPIYALAGSRLHTYPGGIGRYLVSPTYAMELEVLAQESRLPSIRAFAGIFGLVTLMKLLWVRYSRISDEEAAEMVSNALADEARRHGPGGAISVDIRGTRRGAPQRYQIGLFAQDTISLTGQCTALATELVLEGKILKRGFALLCDAVNPRDFIDPLVARGLTLVTE